MARLSRLRQHVQHRSTGTLRFSTQTGTRLQQSTLRQRARRSVSRRSRLRRPASGVQPFHQQRSRDPLTGLPTVPSAAEAGAGQAPKVP